MEKQENFCKRQAQKLCRLFPVAILLFLFLSVPLKGYSNEAFSSEGMQQNTVKVTGTVKDTNGEPIIGANVMVVGTLVSLPILMVISCWRFLLGVNYNLVLLGIRNR